MSVIVDLSKGALKTIREMIVAEVKQDLVVVKGDVSVLKGEVVVIKGDVAVLKGEVVELKGDVAVLKSEVVAIKGDVAVLKGEVVELKSDVAVLKGEVVELKSDVAVLKSDVAVIKSDLSELKKSVANIEQTQLDMRMEHNRYMGKISGQLELIMKMVMAQAQNSAHQGQPPIIEALREDPAPYNVDESGKGKPPKPGDSGA